MTASATDPLTATGGAPTPPQTAEAGAHIYVLPTRFGGAFALVALLTLVGCVNYLLSLGYALTFLLLSVWVVCAVHASRALNGAALTLSLPERALAGQPLPLGVGLSGPGLATQRLGVRAGLSLEWLEGLSGSAEGLLTLPPLARGLHRLPTLRLEGHDPLGLWHSTLYPRTDASGAALPAELLVCPAPEVAPPPPPLAQAEGGVQAERRVAGDEDIHGLREYRPGDAPRRVAWKQAARTGTLLSRTYDAPQASALSLDWTATAAAGDTEARLSRLCAWVLEAERRGSEFSLSLPGTRLEAASGEAQVRRALHLLARHDRPPLPPAPRRRWPPPFGRPA